MRDSDAQLEALEQLAHEALKAWDLDVAAVKLYSQSENTVYRIETTKHEVYALRVHRADYHSLAALESEHVWTSALASAGLSVPQALQTRDGGAYFTVALPNHNQTHHAGLVKWIGGTTLSQNLRNNPGAAEVSEVYETLGGIIADFHLASARWSIPAGFKRHSWDAQGLMGEEPFWGRFWEVDAATDSECDELLATRNQILECLLTLSQDTDVYSMIHADLNANNVLREGDRLTVIDFDDAGFGWHAFDLAVAVWDRIDTLNKTAQFDLAYTALLKGYQCRRPDSEDVLAQVPLFLVVRSLMLLRWMQDRPEAGYVPIIQKVVQLALAQARDLDYACG